MPQSPTSPVGVPTPCSTSAAFAEESLAGTAPVAHVWVIVERHGPFGADALKQSGLPAEMRDALLSLKQAGVKVLLARPAGRHSASAVGTPFRVWCAHPATGRMVSTVFDRAGDLADLDGPTLAAGHLPAWPSAASPAFFVCTNGRRDACCARLGRRAIVGITDADLWECSHLGGHRFAATGLLLPWGYVYGRLDAEQVARILRDARAGHISLDGLRGRSSLSPDAQVADIAARVVSRFRSPDDLAVVDESTTGPGLVEVTMAASDGTRLEVSVLTEDQPTATPPSCGAEPEAHLRRRVVGAVREIARG